MRVETEQLALMRELNQAVSSLGINPDHVHKHGLINALQYALKGREGIECGLTHHFIPGHYIRQITMPKGALVISHVHGTFNPYTVSKGWVSAFNEQDGTVTHIRAGAGYGEHFASLTVPGTRRLLYCHEETTWTTMHPIDDADAGNLPLLESKLLLPNTNPLLQ